MSFEAFLRLLRDTYDRPREVARAIIALQIAPAAAFSAIALAAVLTSILAVLANAIGTYTAGAPPQDPLTTIFDQPLILAGLQLTAMLMGAVLMHRVGRLFGGNGTWRETLSLVAWLQLVFAILQAAQLLLMLALPIFALPLLLFSIFSVFFLTAQFTAALHGFTSVGKVLGGMILTLLVVSLALAILSLPFYPVQHV